MRRLPVFLLMFLFLPGLAEAQDNTRSHTVVHGETLWGLAESYCGDPFLWPEIFQANKSQIADPNVISPDQVLTITCASVGVSGVQIVTPEPEPEPEPAPPFDERSKRSFFYRDLSASVTTFDRPLASVMSRDAAWSASWLNLGTGDPWASGEVVTLLAGEGTRTALPYQRVRVASEEKPELGAVYQIFRSQRLIEGLGTVVAPTGVLSVTSVEDAGFEGVVLKNYDRVEQGDLVLPAPDFDIEPGDLPAEVSSQITATILAFGAPHAIQSIGDVALLDLGSEDGVTLGDEFVLVVGNEDGWTGAVAGRLQVVHVSGETSSARIVQLDHPRFRAGLEVHLDKKMR
jgi:LysM domain-containing protein